MDLVRDLVKHRFGITVARELCEKFGLFEQGRLYRRSDISGTLRDEFVRRGGSDDTTKDSVARVLKKWLLHPDSPFQKEARGLYRFLGSGGVIGQSLEVADRGTASSDAARGDAPTPECEIGAGPYEVYAWCLPRYQATSGDRWPIKIGRAGPGGLRRRLSDFQENLPERPCYLLRLGCADEREARDREALLHAWFRSRRQKLEELPGEEWFLTSPSEIKEAVRHIVEPDALFGKGSALDVEDVIADAFKDVTADDWDRIPEDLTDRLDDYLYRSDLR